MTRLATPRFGLDAAGPIPITAQKAIGSTFDFRYLSRYTWKVIQPGEYYNLIASGIDVGIVFEDDVATARGGYAKGVDDAEWCIAQGAARGLPKDFPCIWAVDYDTAGYCSVLEPYAKGFKSRIPRSGPYGDYYVVEYFGARGYLTWQTYAWSYGRLSKYAMCYQYSNGHNVGGADTDYNRLFDTAVLIDGEQPPPPSTEEPLALASAQLQGIPTVFRLDPNNWVYYTWQPGADAPGTQHDWHGGVVGKQIAGWSAFAKCPEDAVSISSFEMQGAPHVFVEAKSGNTYYTFQRAGERSWNGGKEGVSPAGLVVFAPK